VEGSSPSLATANAEKTTCLLLTSGRTGTLSSTSSLAGPTAEEVA
jgi:hypothetical protein